MLSKSVIVLKKVITGSLKSKPDRRAPMVECRSITPWMMFTSARLLKDRVYAKSKLAEQMHRWDGLFEIIIQLQWFWPWNPYAIDLVSCQMQFASIGAQIFEAAAIRQRLCSWTACMSGSAASNWMQFRLCNFVPSPWIHLIITTDPQNRASRCQ